MTEEQTLTLIIVGVTVLIIIGFSIWLLVSASGETGPFAPYEPSLGEGLTKVLPDEKFTPPTPEEAYKRLVMVCNSWPSLATSTYIPPSPPDECAEIYSARLAASIMEQ